MKARKEAFEEILELLDAGGDAYFRIHAVREHIREALPKKKKPTPPPVG